MNTLIGVIGATVLVAILAEQLFAVVVGTIRDLRTLAALAKEAEPLEFELQSAPVPRRPVASPGRVRSPEPRAALGRGASARPKRCA